jgi:hypothetical protein
LFLGNQSYRYVEEEPRWSGGKITIAGDTPKSRTIREIFQEGIVVSGHSPISIQDRVLFGGCEV